MKFGTGDVAAMKLGTATVLRAYLGGDLIWPSSGYSPAVLFAASEAGFWGEVVIGKLWQDVARTTPVTAPGDPVGSWELSTASGVIYAQQATGTSRPLYQVDDAGKGYLDFDGTDDSLVTNTTVNFSGTSQMTVVAAVQSDTDAAGIICMLSDSGTANGAFYVARLLGGTYSAWARANVAAETQTAALLAPRRDVVTFQYDLAQAVLANEKRIRVNGQYVPVSHIGIQNPGPFGNFTVRIGRLGTASSAFNGRVYGIIIRGVTTTLADLKLAETWAATQAGLIDFSAMWGATDASAWPSYFRGGAFSEVVFDTSATSIDIETVCSIYADYPALSSVGVYVNDAYQEQVDMTANGIATATVALSSGAKRVRLVTGPTSRPTTTLIGTQIRRVIPNSAITYVPEPAAGRLLIYGDSITSGSEATVEQRDAWARLVAADRYPNPTGVEAFGFRSLFDDAANGTLRAAFVARIAAYNPAQIVLAIGTNDYGLNKWSAASFGTAYAALLDDLNTALPSAQIFCVSPTVRTSEVANGSGSTLGDYRTQIATAVSTRTAYATYIDGAPIIVTGDLVDTVHPDTTGHGKIATAVLAAL